MMSNIADMMKIHNNLKRMLSANPEDIFSDQEIAFATFIDFINNNNKDRTLKDVMTISLHFAHAYGYKVDRDTFGKELTDEQEDLIERVTVACQNLKLDII